MKEAREFKAAWEEENLLRLIETINKLSEIYKITFNILKSAASFGLYLIYRAAKGLWLVVNILFLSHPEILRIERDETWIFRQIK